VSPKDRQTETEGERERRREREREREARRISSWASRSATRHTNVERGTLSASVACASCVCAPHTCPCIIWVRLMPARACLYARPRRTPVALSTTVCSASCRLCLNLASERNHPHAHIDTDTDRHTCALSHATRAIAMRAGRGAGAHVGQGVGVAGKGWRGEDAPRRRVEPSVKPRHLARRHHCVAPPSSP
jgi:hypothetical protein